MVPPLESVKSLPLAAIVLHRTGSDKVTVMVLLQLLVTVLGGLMVGATASVMDV